MINELDNVINNAVDTKKQVIFTCNIKVPIEFIDFLKNIVGGVYSGIADCEDFNPYISDRLSRITDTLYDFYKNIQCCGIKNKVCEMKFTDIRNINEEDANYLNSKFVDVLRRLNLKNNKYFLDLYGMLFQNLNYNEAKYIYELHRNSCGNNMKYVSDFVLSGCVLSGDTEKVDKYIADYKITVGGGGNARWMYELISKGDIDMITHMEKSYGMDYSNCNKIKIYDDFYECQKNIKPMMDYLIEKKCIENNKIRISEAMKHGNLELFKFLIEVNKIENNYYWYFTETIKYHAYNITKYIYENNKYHMNQTNHRQIKKIVENLPDDDFIEWAQQL